MKKKARKKARKKTRRKRKIKRKTPGNMLGVFLFESSIAFIFFVHLILFHINCKIEKY